MDRKRPNREQNLIEWAKPYLTNPQKLNRIMDSRLEGQYSTKGAEEAASLAYKCLSKNSKLRPDMKTVVETLEPLLELQDIPMGPFVYIARVESEDDKIKTNINEKFEEKEKIGVNESDKRSKVGHRYKSKFLHDEKEIEAKNYIVNKKNDEIKLTP